MKPGNTNTFARMDKESDIALKYLLPIYPASVVFDLRGGAQVFMGGW